MFTCSLMNKTLRDTTSRVKCFTMSLIMIFKGQPHLFNTWRSVYRSQVWICFFPPGWRSQVTLFIQSALSRSNPLSPNLTPTPTPDPNLPYRVWLQERLFTVIRFTLIDYSWLDFAISPGSTTYLDTAVCGKFLSLGLENSNFTVWWKKKLPKKKS